MKSTIINIKTDGQQTFRNIIGNIKKIFILTNKPMHSVNLTFRTNENEIIYSLNIEQPITVIYPWNFIDAQGRGMEYYSFGDLYVDVEGLEEDGINQISVFYS